VCDLQTARSGRTIVNQQLRPDCRRRRRRRRCKLNLHVAEQRRSGILGDILQINWDGLARLDYTGKFILTHHRIFSGNTCLPFQFLHHPLNPVQVPSQPALRNRPFYQARRRSLCPAPHTRTPTARNPARARLPNLPAHSAPALLSPTQEPAARRNSAA
jgi:hypothetical protein